MITKGHSAGKQQKLETNSQFWFQRQGHSNTAFLPPKFWTRVAIKKNQKNNCDKLEKEIFFLKKNGKEGTNF